MLIESMIKNLSQDIALLQLRIARDKDAGFNDNARLLESMSIQLFKALGIANLENKNQIRVNFPAIDSADDYKDGGIAVQVTSIAGAVKIRKTIAAFEKKNTDGECLKDRYTTLYIVGFCKAKTALPVPQYCRVVDHRFFLSGLLDSHDEEKVQMVIDAIHRHVDYSSLHPHGDVECLRIVLGYVSRNAVRHHMSCEGSIDHMTRGLREISELIGKGTVNNKQKSKAHHEFGDQRIAEFLRNVLNHIGGITAIVNRSNFDGFVCLRREDMRAIDERKRSIAQSAQNIAADYGIVLELGMHDIR